MNPKKPATTLLCTIQCLLIASLLLFPLLTGCTCQVPEENPSPPVSPNTTAVPSEPSPTPPPQKQARAAIVDQLSVLNTNSVFLEQLTQELNGYGLEVDIFKGEEITVEFYRELPTLDYQLIIFRAHSGLLSSEEGVVRVTTLFTNEPYSEVKHIGEQLANRVAKARIGKDHPMIFSIKDSFVRKSMENSFDNTVIIMMGCSCIAIQDLAEAFMDKGASIYLAWDATVGLGYVDRATIYLFQQLCSQNLLVVDAVNATMDEIGADPLFGARLRYFPKKNGANTLAQLYDNSTIDFSH